MSDTLRHSDNRIVGRSAAEATTKLVPLQRNSEEDKAHKAAKKAKQAEKAKAKGKK